MILLLIPSLVSATTYYVDFNAGDNSNDGSLGSPWKECPGTLDPIDSSAGGWVMIQPGDTVIFTAGQIWTRPIRINPSWFGQPAQESGRIVLKSSSTSERAVFDLTGTTSYQYIISIERHYISLEYLELRNLAYSGTATGIRDYGMNVNDHGKIMHCYIHDIQDTSGRESYGLTNGGSSYVEYAYNEIKNTEKKLMSLGGCNYCDVHHNILHQDSDFSGSGPDHAAVITGNNNNFYNNLIWTDQTPGVAPSYAFKLDGEADGMNNSNNKVFNNLILKWPAGIAVFDTIDGGNEVMHNTIYLQDAGAYGSDGSYNLNGISLRGDQSSYCRNNVIRNNIVYYVRAASQGSVQMFLDSPSADISGNTITNNLFYYDGTNEIFRIGKSTSSYHDLTWAETTGNWHGTFGNVMQDNIIANPGFSGGNHPISNIPSGFDSSFVPNGGGLELGGSSAAVDSGIDAGISLDVAGNTRPYDGDGDSTADFDIGAYEYSPVICDPNTYYIDFDSGNDSNDGLCSDSAWKHAPGDPQVTGNAASAVVNPGFTVLFRGGVVYRGTVNIFDTASYSGDGQYQDGSPGSWVELRSGHLEGWGTERAVIDGEGARIIGIQVGSWSANSEVDYVRIEGLEIRNMASGTSSSGILYLNSNYCEIVDNVIHHISGALGASGYGIEMDTNSGNCLIEKNEIYNVEEKAIELYRSDYNVIQYNYIHQTRDHNMVVSSAHNIIRNNICQEAGYSNTGYGSGMRPAYGFKFDSGTSAHAENNSFYNNLIIDCVTGIGILNGKNNRIFQNTVYYTGWDDMYGGGSTEAVAFAMYDDGTAGDYGVEGNSIKNNIFYYSNKHESPSLSAEIYYRYNIGDNNIIQNNLIYLDEGYSDIIRYRNPTTNEYHDIAWFEGPSGFSATGTGNIASGNVVVEPNLKGGTGAAIMSSVPTGFDPAWKPNNDGLSLTDLTHDSVKFGGQDLGFPYNADIDGNLRTSWSLGAYEYAGSPVQTCQNQGYQCCSQCEPGTEQTQYDSDCPGVCCGACEAAAAEQSKYFSRRTSGTVTIDGNLQEFEGLSEKFGSLNTVTGTVISDQDCSAEFWSLWDDSDLYIGIKVTDDVLMDDSSEIHWDDSAEIYIDALNDKSGPYGSDDFQFITDISNTMVTFREGDPITMPSGTQYQILQNPGGYTLEFSIPFSSLGITPAEGYKLGFDIGVNDDDDGSGRDGQIMWNMSDQGYRNTSVFGEIGLMVCTRSDKNCDSCIDTGEMIAFLDRWKISSADVSMPELMESIGLWKSGIGCG